MRTTISTGIVHRPHSLPRVGGLDHGAFHGFICKQRGMLSITLFYCLGEISRFGGNPLPRSVTPTSHDLVLD